MAVRRMLCHYPESHYYCLVYRVANHYEIIQCRIYKLVSAVCVCYSFAVRDGLCSGGILKES